MDNQQSHANSDSGDHGQSSSFDNKQSHVDRDDGAQRESIDTLLQVFEDKVLPLQVVNVYSLADDEFNVAMECLLEGPTLDGLLALLRKRFDGKPLSKVYVDADDLWSDMVGQYKYTGNITKNAIKVVIDDQPAIDTGGVRRQVYTNLFEIFSENKHVKLFEGPERYLRPIFSAETRSSGLLSVLGSMIAHSIAQDGIGFPYLSPLCYWYIVGGEDRALPFVTMSDVGTDVVTFATQVRTCHCKLCMLYVTVE